MERRVSTVASCVSRTALHATNSFVACRYGLVSWFTVYTVYIRCLSLIISHLPNWLSGYGLVEYELFSRIVYVIRCRYWDRAAKKQWWLIYEGGPKTDTHTFISNFAKCLPIFIIFTGWLVSKFAIVGIKNPTTLYKCRYTSLWNITVRK